MKYIGGYSILDLTDANVSAQANACYNQDKPVLVYGENGERYFADTITKSGTNIIITKGGKTITIANDNTVTNVGDIQAHLWHYTICPDTSDFGFNIELPFDLGKNNIIITDADSFNANKEFLQKIVDKVSSVSYSCFSEDNSKCCTLATIIKQLTKLDVQFTLVNFSDGSDETLTFEIALTDGIATSYTSGELQIYRNYQIY